MAGFEFAKVFRAIGLLKRLCNHPLLLLPVPQDSNVLIRDPLFASDTLVAWDVDLQLPGLLLTTF